MDLMDVIRLIGVLLLIVFGGSTLLFLIGVVWMILYGITDDIKNNIKERKQRERSARQTKAQIQRSAKAEKSQALRMFKKKRRAIDRTAQRAMKEFEASAQNIVDRATEEMERLRQGRR